MTKTDILALIDPCHVWLNVITAGDQLFPGLDGSVESIKNMQGVLRIKTDITYKSGKPFHMKFSYQLGSAGECKLLIASENVVHAYEISENKSSGSSRTKLERKFRLTVPEKRNLSDVAYCYGPVFNALVCAIDNKIYWWKNPDSVSVVDYGSSKVHEFAQKITTIAVQPIFGSGDQHAICVMAGDTKGRLYAHPLAEPAVDFHTSFEIHSEAISSISIFVYSKHYYVVTGSEDSSTRVGTLEMDNQEFSYAENTSLREVEESVTAVAVLKGRKDEEDITIAVCTEKVVYVWTLNMRTMSGKLVQCLINDNQEPDIMHSIGFIDWRSFSDSYYHKCKTQQRKTYHDKYFTTVGSKYFKVWI